MNNEQFERLPKYARYEIKRLRANVASYKAQQSEIDAGESDTWIRNYTGEDIYLPSGSAVVFKGDGSAVEVVVRRYNKNSTVGYSVIEVSSSYGGGDHLVVIPRSSNIIQLETVNR